MTLIVGANFGNRTYIAGDHAACDASFHQLIHTPKVWSDGPWLFGVSGSFRVMQLLRYRTNINETMFPPGITPDEDIFNVYMPILEKALEDFEDKQEHGWHLLLGGQGNLWEIQEDFSFQRIYKYTCAGSGSDYAWGALNYLEVRLALPPANVNATLGSVIKAASKNCHFVSEDYTVVQS